MASKSATSKADAFLEAALVLFSTKGFGEVRMQEIAQKANATYSLLYYYYRSKDELFHAAVSYSVSKAIANYTALEREHDSPIAWIEGWFESNVRYSKDLKFFVKMLIEFADKRDRAPWLAGEIDYFYDFERNLLSKAIAEGVEQGIFRCECSDKMAGFVSCHIDGIFYRALVRPQFDVGAAMGDLRTTLWRLLEYEEAPRLRNECVRI